MLFSLIYPKFTKYMVQFLQFGVCVICFFVPRNLVISGDKFSANVIFNYMEMFHAKCYPPNASLRFRTNSVSIILSFDAT